ncbi:MAG: Fatty acid desaturase [Saprospiraceae bacterium]|nr:Fatty acid desaturase [Saprospiraceae bacterium]
MHQASDKDFLEKVKLALQTIKPWQKTDGGKAAIQLLTSFGPFLLLWIVIYLVWDLSTWAAVGLSMVNALFLVRIFIIQHDCGHQSFVSNGSWRKLIGHACSLMSSIPYTYWAGSHQFHHANNGRLEVRDIGDIDTLTVREYAALSRWGRFRYRLYRSPLVMFFLGPIYYVFIHNRLPLIHLPEFRRFRPGLLLSNVVYLTALISLCFLLDWQKFLAIHTIILCAFAVVAIWFFYVQHQHEHGYKHWRDKWEFAHAAVQGSSFYRLPRWLNWFTGNIAYHHIHHLNPAIPNYHLRQCMEAIPWFSRYTTEIRFFESLRLAGHKLWDEQSERMIGFREYARMQRMGAVL